MNNKICKRQMLKFGKIKIHLPSRKVFVEQSIITLRNKEYSLLEYLINNVGKVLSRTQILEDVWDHNICNSTNTVDVHVSTLRQKLKKYLRYDPIKTVHCIGYMID